MHEYDTDIDDSVYDQAASGTIDLANGLAEDDPEANLDEIADGVIAGAVQFWLYTREPCGDPRCEDCAPLSTAAGRLGVLQRLVDELARSSEYFHSPNDSDAGHA